MSSATSQDAASSTPWPRISVVTPSFNQGQYVEETLRSVLDQDYPQLEYIVMDGGSSDGSREIIERYSERLAFWRSAADDGQAAALREGFARATGDILTWVNSDDLLAPGALFKVAEAWRRHGGGVIVVGACQLFDAGGRGRRHLASFQQALDVPEPMPPEKIFDLARHWFPGEFFYQPEVFFPRAAYEQIGGVDPSYYYTMDYDLWARFALAATPVVVIDETLALFREHDEQKTSDRRALYREMVTTANTYLDEVPLEAGHRRRLQRWNRRAAHLVVREAFKLLRRVQPS
jgi:glycosyltransferase involved in cell wall biosynthesis